MMFRGATFLTVFAVLACSSRSFSQQTARQNAALSVVELQTANGVDFAAVAKAIGDARIVMLGEPWHGDGGAIRIRGELVKYLHQQHGFDVLVFEADFYALHRGWQRVKAKEDIRAFARDNIYPFW